MWLELELDAAGEDIRVIGRGSRGERPAPHALPPERSFEALQTFANKVARAVRGGKAIDPAVVTDAQALFEAVFAGEIRDVFMRLSEKAKDSRLLVRLLIRDRALQSIPWEALCRPGTTEGFWGTDPRMLVARGVTSSEPWEPREVRGAVRVLAIAPGSDDRALTALREALGPAIDTGEVEWLEPIAGQDISPRALFDRLRRGKSPHIVHFLGHGGVDLSARPVLRLADDEDGEEVWITAEALGRELSSSFSEELRLVVLEACEGAKAGAFGSAAEILAKAGADAVVAHLWPVKADVARTCSSVLYRALTASDRTQGDIGASVAAARSTLLTQSAEAFSPVLYLRGSGSVIFNFEGRRIARPGSKRGSKSLTPALQSVLEKKCSMVLGTIDEDRFAFHEALKSFMLEHDEGLGNLIPFMPLMSLTQRCAMRFGEEVLHSLLQETLLEAARPAPPLIRALARLVKPGVHVTLLWQPHLERAIAESQPRRTVYSIHPSFADSNKRPRVVKRAAGTTAWKLEPMLPKRFDLDNEIVVLRLYGGYSAEPRPIFSLPLLTEDDHTRLVISEDGYRPPGWMTELLARPRTEPNLFVGLSIYSALHRMLLRWLYERRPAPKDSLAILVPPADPSEAEIWASGSGNTEIGQIKAIAEDPSQLASLLEAYEPAEAS